MKIKDIFTCKDKGISVGHAIIPFNAFKEVIISKFSSTMVKEKDF